MSVDNLANLLDALTETSVYVIEEETHRLLYFNGRCRATGRGRVALGAPCHEVWPEVCANCPLDALGDKTSTRIVRFDPLLKTTVDITVHRMMWDGHIRAVALTATPHCLNFDEEQGLKKIEQMYARSLVTVFDECVIVNLTDDYYVNCHRDAMWCGIPEQGNFGTTNRNYAAKTLHPDDVGVFDAHFSRAAMLRLFEEGKKQISRRLRRLAADGTYHMVEFTAAKLEHPREEACWCVLVFRDVQDAYALEQQRSIEISQLATAARIAYQMLISVNLTQNTYHMLEYERFPVRKPGDAGCFDDLIERELATVHPDHQREFMGKFSRRALCDAFNRGEPIVAMEVPHLGKDGVYHWHFTQVVRVKSPYTDDLIEITLSRNIDEERRQREEALEKERRAKQMLEEALQKAEKASRAKSDFLSKMSHDIRTPMNAIVGMTELAQRHLGEEEKQRDYLQKIASSGTHLLGLINDVLDVNKVENGAADLEEIAFDLRDLVRDAVEMVRLPLESRRQTLSVSLDGDLHPQVLGDARRLKQVLVNILENSSKYTGDQGRISLSLEEVHKEEWRIGTYRFVIEDTGIGMKPEFLKHIFEPFSRADDSRISKIAGTGLGMTIVQNLLAMMGGSIQVESEPGKGSKFIITLLLGKCDAPAAASTDQPRTEETFPGLRVLLVEDNELNRQIATEMLKLLNVRVDVAQDGRQAVETVQAHPPFHYDMVFMDIQMPRLNGYDATREIRNSGREGSTALPIIAMTADAFPEDAKRAVLAGMNGHMAKPISIDQLRSALSNRLAGRRRDGGARSGG